MAQHTRALKFFIILVPVSRTRVHATAAESGTSTNILDILDIGINAMMRLRRPLWFHQFIQFGANLEQETDHQHVDDVVATCIVRLGHGLRFKSRKVKLPPAADKYKLNV